jgi:hypothetical protein
VQSGSTILQVLDAPLEVDVELAEAEPLATSSETAAAAKSAKSAANRFTAFPLLSRK